MYDINTNFLNAHEWAYGVTEVVHISALALSIGTIAAVDLRLMGAGVRASSAEGLARQLAPWTLAGLALVIVSGLMIFSTDPLRYYYHPTFRLKIELLVLGLLYNYTLHSVAVRPATPMVLARVAAVGSIALWVSVVFCGLFYAFT
jgi:hypothetical protein